MKIKILKIIAPAIVILLTVVGTYAQSPYFQAITNLNPVAYWPLQETTQPPRYDVETNLGSLGAIANICYASTNAAHAMLGAIAGEADTSVNFLGNNNSFALVPVTDHRISLPAGQPFTVECWARDRKSVV